MRRLLFLLALAAALVPVLPAAGGLRPVVRRGPDGTPLPRVRPGHVSVPPGHARGRIRVIARLAEPPLAAYARSLAGPRAARKLNVGSATSRAWLARLAGAQRAAVADLRRAVPSATVGRRFRILLDGLTIDLPARDLPRLVRRPWVTRVYGSARFRLALDDSPALIGAPALAAATGARGEGMKIAVVDDGVDQRNRFFSPKGLTYPPGYPRGGRAWTTPKVIVARAFPGPGSGRGGRLALDPEWSFHGTHVAGIAAGVAGTRAPAGDDHPATPGLSGVAPRARIGNYRVFTVPTPVGAVANTPEIIAAFEAAVADGMDVINFSGGGPEAEPANDAMIETIRNVAAAGVVPVIAAGNDRDDFGLGTAGSPGSAPDAISVAAVSNAHVFAPVLRAAGAPPAASRIPYRPTIREIPAAWRTGKTVVDAGSLRSRSGGAVDPRLCGPAKSPNGGPSPLRPGALKGAVALVWRGRCTFASKAARVQAAGGAGILVVDNRPGEANQIPIDVGIPGGMLADVDGAALRELVLGPKGGRARILFGRKPERVENGRSDVVASFSSAGPTAFGHRLKPDVSAPGTQILSSTLVRAGGPFAVFDGTSMATPHVAGAAALLRQLHPGWAPAEVKSALMSTAGPAYADTLRATEAPVLLEGAGIVRLTEAARPLVFTAPASLSFGDLDVTKGAAARPLLLSVADAGDGGGPWAVEVRPQSATAGASVETAGTLEVAPGGSTYLTVVATAAAGAAPGANYGLLVLRRGDAERRVPYLFVVARPALAHVPLRRLQRFQEGTTARGPSRVGAYRYPSAALGQPPDYTGPPMRQDGAERLYSITIDEPVANFGVSVVLSSGRSVVDPWVLGSRDEGDVQGVAGTPVNVNGLMDDYRVDVGAAGAATPRPKTYYVAVDSPRDPFSGKKQSGRYLLRSWVNDVTPPAVGLVSTRVAAGRPTLVLRVVDPPRGGSASGIDVNSLTLAYGDALLSPAAYDPIAGIAVFPLGGAPRLGAGREAAVVVVSDLQETKNVNATGADILPNTTFAGLRLRIVRGPAASWVFPERRACVARREHLLVVASSTRRVRSVRFLDGRRRIAVDRRGIAGLFETTWATGRARPGRHVLRAVVTDAAGRTFTAERVARVCR